MQQRIIILPAAHCSFPTAASCAHKGIMRNSSGVAFLVIVICLLVAFLQRETLINLIEGHDVISWIMIVPLQCKNIFPGIK